MCFDLFLLLRYALYGASSPELLRKPLPAPSSCSGVSSLGVGLVKKRDTSENAAGNEYKTTKYETILSRFLISCCEACVPKTIHFLRLLSSV